MKNDRIGLFLLFVLILLSFVLIILPTVFSQEGGRVSVDRNIDLPLFQSEAAPVLLTFFGYTGCTDICTPRLHQIANWFDSLPDAMRSQVRFFFFDLSRPESETMPDGFARAFHQDFRGVSLDNESINEYTRAFDVYYAPSLKSVYEYDHSPHLYMLKKGKNGYHLRHIYFAYPYNMEQIQTDLKELLNE